MLLEEKYAEFLAEGKEEGRAEGKAEGRAEGRAQGQAEGRVQGRTEEKRNIAEKLLKDNIPKEKVMEYSGLPEEEIEKIAKAAGL